jgi:hypothetical protein
VNTVLYKDMLRKMVCTTVLTRTPPRVVPSGVRPDRTGTTKQNERSMKLSGVALLININIREAKCEHEKNYMPTARWELRSSQPGRYVERGETLL